MLRELRKQLYRLKSEYLLNVGQELVNQQEKQNNPQMGWYRQEGIVLNVETP